MDPALEFFHPAENGTMRADSFFVIIGPGGSLNLTRAGQRFLLELDKAHGSVLREWGRDREESECYADEEQEEARQHIVEWVAKQRAEWGRRFRRHIGHCSEGGGVSEKEHGKKGKGKERVKYMTHLEKQLRTKKGKANLVRRTKKQKARDKAAQAKSGGSDDDSGSDGTGGLDELE